MLLVEVNFVWLSALLAEASWRRDEVDGLCFVCRSTILIFALFGIGFELCIKMNKLELELVEDVEFFLIEKLFVVGYPYIV